MKMLVWLLYATATAAAAHGSYGGYTGGYTGEPPIYGAPAPDDSTVLAPAPVMIPEQDPAPPTKLFGPCTDVESGVVTSWNNGNEADTNYQYQVDVSNHCSQPIFDNPVHVEPADSVTQHWNSDFNSSSGLFNFPQWAKTWGIYPQSKLTFGFISRGKVRLW